MIGHRILGRYEIVRPIGQGGMGTVYEARDLSEDRRVAIKWLNVRPFAAEDPDLLRFQQEARIAGSLASPHIATVAAADRDPETGIPFQVVELLLGEDARALLGRVGPLSPGVALRIVAQACEGLGAAHAAGVVHRDIKPENLFLARRGDGEVIVKVLDFGIAKIRRGAEPSGDAGALTAPAISMTKSGQMLGTPLYMAPEQIDAPREVDARSDVYSMGVTLYALLAGAPPHAGIKSFVELLHAITTQPPPPLGEAAPWVRAEIAFVVEKAMAHDPDDRFSSTGAMLDAIRPLLPEGLSLRGEDLVGVSPGERAVVVTRAESHPFAKTERSADTVKTARRAAAMRRAVLVAIAMVLVAIAAGIALFAR